MIVPTFLPTGTFLRRVAHPDIIVRVVKDWDNTKQDIWLDSCMTGTTCVVMTPEDWDIIGDA